MTRRSRVARSPFSARLWVESGLEGSRFWSEAAGRPPPVYGERWADRDGRWIREWSPQRSKLAAALNLGWEEPLPREGECWLYLGAATGTTVSHVADLLGPSGALYAVEKSVRPFAGLLALSERWSNIRPVLRDVRTLPEEAVFIPLVDGLYVDVAQPDQVEIAVGAARRFLKEGGAFLLALKTASMGRELTAPEHLERAEARSNPSLRSKGPSA